MSSSPVLVVLGGSTPVGELFIKRLHAAGLKADIVTRHPLSVPEGFTNSVEDLSRPGTWRLPAGATIVSFLPLWILSGFLPRLSGARALIATGSTSLFGKANSSDGSERRIAELLGDAENALQLWVEQNGAAWTILRPTIIYDCRNDKNITRMARFIRRWHFLPIAFPAKGLRQPIHTDDVAHAAFQCLGNADAANKTFNIAGGEIIAYRVMAERVFAALGRRPRFVMLPVGLLQGVFKIAATLGIIKKSTFSAAVFQRMNEDLIFDTADGLKILNYQPRPFRPTFQDLA